MAHLTSQAGAEGVTKETLPSAFGLSNLSSATTFFTALVCWDSLQTSGMFALLYSVYTSPAWFWQNNKEPVFVVHDWEINGFIEQLSNIRNDVLEGRWWTHTQLLGHAHIIFPFTCPTIDDKTRVAIGENMDYINASYIRMQVGDEEFFYISCQGPLPSTVPAFWQMIWENKSDIIAMMTQVVERGRVKCHKYWPEKPGVPVDAGRYQVHLENRQYLEYFHIKVIRVVDTEVRDVGRNIYQSVSKHADVLLEWGNYCYSRQLRPTSSVTWSSRTGLTTASRTTLSNWFSSSATWGPCTTRGRSPCTAVPASGAQEFSSALTLSSASLTVICLWVWAD